MALFAGARYKVYKRNQYVIRKGQLPNGLMQIARGTVRIEMQLPGRPQAQGMSSCLERARMRAMRLRSTNRTVPAGGHSHAGHAHCTEVDTSCASRTLAIACASHCLR